MERVKTYASNHSFELVFSFFQVAIIILYSQLTTYGDMGNYYAPGQDPTGADAESFYPYFQDVQVMMFVGFGFLMTFLRSHSWTSVGVNFLVAVVVIEMYILAHGFWFRVFEGEWDKIEINVHKLLTAELCVAATLISFGGVCGKVSPFQLLLMTVIETWFYALNEVVFFDQFKAVDIGGSMNIHTFGAYFGLTVAWIVSPRAAKDHPGNSSSYTSNLFAWIGTLFLWMYWPSFNGALGSGAQRQRAVTNTVLSLAASTLTTFITSGFFHEGKFHAEDALNATLAGGVIMGASADLILEPYASLIVGSCAGIISALGFNVIGPWLTKHAKLYDTCGINNLHGMPGISGGIVSIITVRAMTDSSTGFAVGKIFPGRTANHQSLMQLAGLGLSLGLGIFGGLFTSAVLKLPCVNQPKELFQDSEFWAVHMEEELGEPTKPS